MVETHQGWVLTGVTVALSFVHHFCSDIETAYKISFLARQHEGLNMFAGLLVEVVVLRIVFESKVYSVP